MTGSNALFVSVDLESPRRRGSRVLVPSVPVNARALLSWFPASVLHALGIERRKQWQFRRADGTLLTRWSGDALVHVAGRVTIDEVVFGEESDSVVLGSRTLSGLNLAVDLATMRLRNRGPAPAAAAGVGALAK